MSQAVYFPSFWSRSFVGLDVAIRRSFVRTSRLYFWKFWVERGTWRDTLRFVRIASPVKTCIGIQQSADCREENIWCRKQGEERWSSRPRLERGSLLLHSPLPSKAAAGWLSFFSSWYPIWTPLNTSIWNSMAWTKLTVLFIPMVLTARVKVILLYRSFSCAISGEPNYRRFQSTNRLRTCISCKVWLALHATDIKAGVNVACRCPARRQHCLPPAPEVLPPKVILGTASFLSNPLQTQIIGTI